MNTEPTNDETKSDQPEASAPAPEASSQGQEAPAPTDDSVGKLTPEEQGELMKIRGESQQLLAKIGEHVILGLRVASRIEELDARGQEIINAVSARLGLKEGQTWVGLQDGTIKVVNSNQGGQNQGGGPPPG